MIEIITNILLCLCSSTFLVSYKIAQRKFPLFLLVMFKKLCRNVIVIFIYKSSWYTRIFIKSWVLCDKFCCCYYLLCQVVTVGFQWSPSDSKSPQLSRTLLSIQSQQCCRLDSLISSLNLQFPLSLFQDCSKGSTYELYHYHLHILWVFFSSLARSRYLFSFSFSFIFANGNA